MIHSVLEKSYSKKGFTLIELLVVIAIIGVLSTMAIIALGNARAKARDAKRVADIKQISTALELYYADNNSYPTIITPGNSLTSPSGSITYMSAIPSNPTPRNDGNCSNSDYSYSSNSNNSSFSVSTCLGSSSSNINAGVVSYSPEGSFNCGQKMSDVEGTQYDTVQVGSQCWMKQNLRTKKYPDGSCINSGCPNASASDNGLGRSCYGNNEVNPSPFSAGGCDTDGALYTWTAAMNGSTIAGAQGICPNGWHLPSDVEYNTLDQYLTDSGQVCDANRSSSINGCFGAGTKLGVGGTSGYEAIKAGYRLVDGSTFGARTTHVIYWSSTQSGANAYHREISTMYFSGLVYRALHSKLSAMSIRCIKN
ncbi:MAG: prepilin-type N-terminal cleavage/methylation domain-containing protein [Candidatus Falkowbacteria bacterium]|nr:prepilin-type N-terminal cleavage/methylation domain-containing protein [Candidatus Falkowbacteria bacterium]